MTTGEKEESSGHRKGPRDVLGVGERMNLLRQEPRTRDIDVPIGGQVTNGLEKVGEAGGAWFGKNAVVRLHGFTNNP